MFDSSSIQETLAYLVKQYEQALNIKKKHGQKLLSLYSKSALLEVCGWIEESMKGIIREFARTRLNKENLEYLENNIVNKNYGFDYEPHFRRMLISLIGIIQVEKLENEIDPKKFEPFKGTLRTLKQRRNDQAHSHLPIGVTPNLDAPSVIQEYFKQINEGLKEIEKLLRKE